MVSGSVHITSTPPPSQVPLTLSASLGNTNSFQSENSPERDSAPKKMRNKFEQFFYDRFGEMPDHHQHFYQTDEDLNRIYRALGFEGDQLAELRRQHDERMDGLMDLNGPGIQMKGFKPGNAQLDIGYEDVYIIKIPGEGDLAIRFYPGGMAAEAIYMLDFFDLTSKKGVNSRATGFEIHVVSPQTLPDAVSMRGFVPRGRLTSWEVNWGLKEEDIKCGEERFSLPEGSTLKLVRGERDHAFFRVPVRQREVHVNQPVLEAVRYTG